MKIIRCRNCPYWTADPNDNGMGTCIGMMASGVVEFNVGGDGVNELEVLTPANHFCSIPNPDIKDDEDKPIPIQH